MPVVRPPLVNGEIYHIVIHAVDPLKLFRDEKNYLRMVHDLFEFNNENPASWHYRQYYENRSRSIDKGFKKIKVKEKRKLLVEILGFCLMPNHVHLLVRQVKDGGISKFMRKIGAGYGIYYNQKYQRKGHIFQGKYRIVHIRNEEQLKTVFVYIHTNPVALVFSKWKEQGIRIKDLNKVIKFLEDYRWSSYSDYLQIKNFPSLTSREFLFKIMGGVKGCREFVNDWLQCKKELADYKYITIE
ncbi:transposase [Candidatus Parcubacteria bacterium]|nr:transposase [Candidatus Parcubacteria bacterium]